MGDVLFQYPNATSATTTLTFRPGVMQKLDQRRLPIQMRQLSESGRMYIYTLHTNVEQEFVLEISGLTETSDGSYAGYSALLSFVSTTLSWAAQTFAYTDPESNTTTVRLWQGFEQFREGRPRQRYWSGTLILRKEL